MRGGVYRGRAVHRAARGGTAVSRTHVFTVKPGETKLIKEQF